MTPATTADLVELVFLWDAARVAALDAKRRRNAIRCDYRDDETAACFIMGYIDGTSEACESCQVSQPIHAEYRRFVTQRQVLIRKIQRLATRLRVEARPPSETPDPPDGAQR